MYSITTISFPKVEPVVNVAVVIFFSLQPIPLIPEPKKKNGCGDSLLFPEVWLHSLEVMRCDLKLFGAIPSLL